MLHVKGVQGVEMKKYLVLAAALALLALICPAPAVYHQEAALSVLARQSAQAETSSQEMPDAAEAAVQNGMLQVEILREAAENPYAGKRILIYHTHTYEAYEQMKDEPYDAIEKWRTDDSAHNVTAVGAALSASLTAMGFEVVHDATAFEVPSHDEAYERSLAMLEERAARGETYDLYIDLHRDAVASTSTIKRTVNIGGEEIARFMVVVGQGTTGGYEQKPDWQANKRIAGIITDALNEQCAGLARDVKIKTGRFNQHIADCCILIECGMNCNTLEQAIAGVPYLAQAIAAVFDQETEAP